MDDPSVGPKIPQALEKILQLKESRQEEMNAQQGERGRPEVKDGWVQGGVGALMAAFLPHRGRGDGDRHPLIPGPVSLRD